MVGAGRWGPHLIRNFNDHLSSDVRWVVDTDARRRKAVGERFPKIRVTAEMDPVLSDPRVDAVVVATPTSTHAEIAGAALEASKHVMVEKPLARSLKDAIRLCKLADERDRVLLVGHVFLFNPAYAEARERVASGYLGRIKYISMTRTNLGPVRRDVNAAWDLASHDIAIANHWLNSMPQVVSACGGSWLNEGVEDVVFATLSYPGGTLVHIEASWLNPRKRRLVSVVGEERMLTVDDMDVNEPLRIYNKGVAPVGEDEIADTLAGFRSQIREGEVVIPHVTSGEPLRAECEAFLARIQGAPDRVSDGWSGTDVVAVLEAIDRSMSMRGTAVDVENPR